MLENGKLRAMVRTRRGPWYEEAGALWVKRLERGASTGFVAARRGA